MSGRVFPQLIEIPVTPSLNSQEKGENSRSLLNLLFSPFHTTAKPNRRRNNKDPPSIASQTLCGATNSVFSLIGGSLSARLFARSIVNRLCEMIERARVRLNGWQQAAVAVGSAFGALLDPRRADLIAALGETTGTPAFQRVLERMKRSPEGRAVLLERPRVISANVGHAWDMAPNTFGAAYAKFMGSRNFSPDDRPPVRFMETDELAYVATRAREVHDFWHTLFGLPTNLIGESALKVIEFEQMLLPMCALSVVGGTARFSDKQRKLFYQHYFPWALRAGVRCTDLMCVYYERHFDEDLEDVRRRWGIIPAPAPQPNATT